MEEDGGPAHIPLVVHHRQQLDQLLAERQPVRRFRTLSFPSLTRSQRGLEIEKALNRHWQSCGCTVGAAAAGLATAVAVIAAVVGTPAVDNVWTTSLVFIVGSAFFGKFVGVLFSRWRMRVWLTRARQALPWAEEEI